jgi:hypothetical protein
LNLSSSFAQVDSIKLIIEKSVFATLNLNEIKYRIKNTERVDGELKSGEQIISYQAKKERAHVYFLVPTMGAELIFAKNENNGNAIYYPNGFPYFTMTLDPMGFLMRRNNHHTVNEIGFSYIGEILNYNYKQNPELFTYNGIVNWKNMKCYEIQAYDENFSIINYKVQKNEDLNVIAQKLRISEFMILENNPKLAGYNSVKENDIIKIPSRYGKKITFYIDAKTNLPVKLVIFDNKGVFEDYEYTEIDINPKFNPNLFSPSHLGKVSKKWQ